MARTKQNQRPASTITASTRGGAPPSKVTVALLSVSALAAVWSVGMLTPVGRVAYVYLFFYAEFYAGVLTLVTLSLTVMGGVLATDRMVMQIPHRVLLQSAHRTTGIIAVVSLTVHITTQVSMGTITTVDVLVPFLAADRAAFIGLGTIASYLLFSTFWVGIVRVRFAGRGRPWMWRALHSTAYVSWPVALVHGLNTGRPPATWVTLSYIGCVLLVVIALLVRLSVNLNRKKAWAATGTGSMKPVGKPAAAAEPARKSAGRPRRRQQREVAVEVAPERTAARPASRRGGAATAVLESRTPADGRRRPRRPTEERAAPEPRRRPSSEERYAEPPRRRPTPAEDDVAPEPRRRPTSDDGYADEPRRRSSSSEDGYAAPPPPRRRPAPVEEDVAPEPRRRSSSSEDGYADQPRRRPAAAEDSYAPESRRRAAASEVAPEPRRRSSPEGGYPPPARRSAADDYRPERASADDPYAGRDATRRSIDDYRPAADPPRHPVDDYLATVDQRGAERRGADYPVADYLPEGSTPGWSDTYAPTDSRSRWSQTDRPDPRAESDDRSRRTPPAPRLGPQPPRMDPDARSRDFGRHSMDEAYQPAAPARATGYDSPTTGYDSPAAGYDDPAAGYDNPATYLPPDDTPTLIDMASRRARRSTAGAEGGRSGNRAARRGRRAYEDSSDDMYWRRLKGEAQ